METEIANLSRRYVVQTAETAEEWTAHYPDSKIVKSEEVVDWTFHRAFKTIEDATAYADRIAEDFEYVRVVDKGEQSN